MSEPRLCCNCLHCARWRKKDGIECHCDLNDKYLGYLTVMDEENDCKHWEKETKWDLQREHEKRIRAEVIEEYKHNLKETFNNEFPTNFHCTKPYFTLDNVRVLTDAVAREMKEQNNDN